MEPKQPKVETEVGSRYVPTAEEWQAAAEAIRVADEQDGTLAFIDAVAADLLGREADEEE